MSLLRRQRWQSHQGGLPALGLVGGLGRLVARKVVPGVGGLARRVTGRGVAQATGRGVVQATGTAVTVGSAASAVRAARAGPLRRVLPGAGAVAAGAGLGAGAAMLAGRSPRKSRRRINAGNAKALKRAIRRVERFRELAASVGFTKPPRSMQGVRCAPARRRRKKC